MVFEYRVDPTITDDEKLLMANKLLSSTDEPSEQARQNPNTWPINNNLQEGLKIIKTLKVVNDMAERGIKLITDFNDLLTNDKEQKQYVLQIVFSKNHLPRRNLNRFHGIKSRYSHGLFQKRKTDPGQIVVGSGRETECLWPSTKSIPEWRKTWTDWRRHIKSKLAHNKAECRKTGGGQVNKYILSSLEEGVAVLCGLYVAVDGIKSAKVFGGSGKENEKPSTSTASSNDEYMQDAVTEILEQRCTVPNGPQSTQAKEFNVAMEDDSLTLPMDSDAEFEESENLLINDGARIRKDIALSLNQ
ncbi:uncharacterized protein LOC142224940 [Haematobia irritans]|uniref:uncharacterized protein LOC142224940 n=1 Tax=Haematobia irritans TaxID=7368 RepID=UPI003F4FAA71